MKYEQKELKEIYHCTDGYCHLCHKKLSINNYGKIGARGAWEVDHSIPRANGGTNRKNNLRPACIFCNRSKQDRSTRTTRTQNGVTRAPHSKEKKKRIRKGNMLKGAAVGGLAGAWLGGPIGIAVGVTTGAILGHSIKPEKS
ncbi:MAG: HNH endonuclease [Opitutaceae bacterium]|jgi:5-methylcytosine-specific restriction endonuclease McrA|nr:HNH endonuclease [Opitutaceae bacterium]